MKYIVDKDGNELRRVSFQRVYEIVSKNIGIFLAVIPLTGMAASAVFNFLIYIYTKGQASYFNVPDQYLIINQGVTIYSIILHGSIALVCVAVARWTVRTILRQRSWGRKILVMILTGGILPMLFLLVVIIFVLDTPSQVFELSREDWIEFFIFATITILCLHGPFVYTAGYLATYPVQKYLIKRRYDDSRKEDYYHSWKYKNHRILGAVVCVIAIIGFGWYYYYLGFQSVEKQKDFQITMIDGHTYVVVMMDGNEAVVGKCDAEEGGTLKVNTGEYMKVECINLLLQERHFAKGIARQDVYGRLL